MDAPVWRPGFARYAAARLLLVANVQKTIRAGLGILGISAPVTM